MINIITIFLNEKFTIHRLNDVLKGLVRYFAILAIIISIGFNSFSQKSVESFFVQSPPVIDGFVIEDSWHVTDSATDFIQMEPAKGAPASEKTVVYITYDNEKVYFGIKCYARDPSRIVAKVQARDALSKNDDLISILLDTYQDKRSAFGFFVNPLGVQIDMKVADDGRTRDINWDTEWESAAVRTSDGWSAEVAIPFQSITYNRKISEWGINFGRVIRLNFETSYWSGELNDDFRVSQGGLLTGLNLPAKKKIVELTPYVTLRYEDSDETNIHGKVVPQAGLDAHLNISSNVVSHLTYNPDFATVEGDQEKINMTRWELSFPEKRLFFLEGNELLKTRIKTFYSRRIGDIKFGGKINGKIKDFSFYAMNSQTKPDSIVKTDTTIQIPTANYTTVKVKKDILNSSTIGFTYVDKKWEGNYTSSASLDFMLNLGKTWKISGQWVTSFPGDMMPSSAYFLRVARESNIYHYHIRYSYTGKNFKKNVNQTGFVREDDMKEIDADITYRWWFDGWLKYINLGTYNNVFWSTENVLRSWYLTQRARMYLKSRFSFDFSYNNEYKLYEKKYYNHRYGAVAGYNTDEWSSASIAYYTGVNFDRNFNWFKADARVKLFKKLSLTYSFNKLDYYPDPRLNSTIINIVSVDYNFTNDLWVRVFAQNNTRNDKIYFYGMFGWRFQPPFGAVYLIYNSDNFEDPILGTRSNNDVIFLKASYRIGF